MLRFFQFGGLFPRTAGYGLDSKPEVLSSVRASRLGGAEKMSNGREAHSRSLAKAVSWRLTGSLDTFVISFIVTGHLAVAGSIAATELITKILLYYFHERAWTFIPWGRQPN
jgi:uncharacterized membrane protein